MSLRLLILALQKLTQVFTQVAEPRLAQLKHLTETEQGEDKVIARKQFDYDSFFF